MLHILNTFHNVSDQSVNFSNFAPLFLLSLHHKFNKMLFKQFKMKYLLSSYIYSGAPLWFGCRKIADFQYLSAKIHSRIVSFVVLGRKDLPHQTS